MLLSQNYYILDNEETDNSCDIFWLYTGIPDFNYGENSRSHDIIEIVMLILHQAGLF